MACKFIANNGIESKLHEQLIKEFGGDPSALSKIGAFKEIPFNNRADDLYAFVQGSGFRAWFGDFTKEDLPNTDENGEPVLQNDGEYYFEREDGAREYLTGEDSIFSIQDKHDVFELLRFGFIEALKSDDRGTLISFISESSSLEEALEGGLTSVMRDTVDRIVNDENKVLTDSQMELLEKLYDNQEQTIPMFSDMMRRFYSNLGITFKEDNNINEDENGNDKEGGTSIDSDFSPSVESDPIKTASRAVKVYLSHIAKSDSKSKFGEATYESFNGIQKTLIRLFSDAEGKSLSQFDMTFGELFDLYIDRLGKLENEFSWATTIIQDLNKMKENGDINSIKQFMVGLTSQYYNYTVGTFDTRGNVKYISTSASEGNAQRIISAWNTDFISNKGSLQQLSLDKVKNESDTQEGVVSNVVDHIFNNLSSFGINIKRQAIEDVITDENSTYLTGNTEEKALKILNFFNDFVEDIQEKKEKGDFFDNSGREKSIIKENEFIREIAKKQVLYMEDNINESVQRPSGQSYSFSKPTFIKDQLDRILNAKNSESYIKNLQNNKYYAVSKWFQALADKTKRAAVNMMSHFKKDRANDAGSDNKDIKLADELSMNITMMLRAVTAEGRKLKQRPVFRTLTAGDKSRAFHIEGDFPITQTEFFNDNKLGDNVVTRVVDYVNAEFTRAYDVAKQIKAVEKGKAEGIMYYNTGEKNGLKIYSLPELSHQVYNAVVFDKSDPIADKINQETKDLILDLHNKIKEVNKIGLYSENGMPMFADLVRDSEISDDIRAFIENIVTRKVLAGIAEMNSIFHPNVRRSTGSRIAVDQQILNEYNARNNNNEDAAINNILADYFVNQFFANIEYTKMFTGDPAYYKNEDDFRKRVQATYIDGDVGIFGDFKGKTDNKFKVAVTKKIFRATKDEILEEWKEYIGDKIENYKSNNIADAQAWITLDRWIQIEKSLGRWTKTHDEIFKKVNKGKDLNKEQLDFVLKNHPPQSMKGVYFNIDETGRPTYLKYSQAVLIPQLIKGSPTLEKMATQMKAGGIDELVTLDGIKVGAPSNMFDANLDIENSKFLTLELDATKWRLQQDLPTKGVKQQDVGSQIMKNILANIKLDGDYILDGKTVKGSQIKDEIFEIIKELSDEGTLNFKKEIYQTDENGKIIEGKIDRTKVTKLILDNLRDVDENIEYALNRGTSFDVLPNIRTQVQNTLFSQIAKAMKPKTLGAGFIQVAPYGFENFENRSDVIWLKEGEKVLDPPREANNFKGEFLVSGSLLNKLIQKKKPGETYKTYITDKKGNIQRNEDGSIDTSRLFGPEGLFNSVSDLSAIGYRIPNQGLSSNDALTIAGILPDIAGDIIVPYGEITTKTGSDFDIDKMYVMFKNIEPNFSKGKRKQTTDLVSNLMGAMNLETPNNRLISLYESILTNREHTVPQTLNPLDSSELQDFIEKELGLKKIFDLFDPVEDLKLKHNIKGGKANVGITANHIVNTVYAQLGQSEILADLGVGHYNEKTNSTALYEQYVEGSDNEYITKTLNDFLNAFVDINKDPYIVNGNYNTKTTGIAFMLIRAGASKEWVTSFLKQPAIDRLLKGMEMEDASVTGFVPNDEKALQRLIKSYEVFGEMDFAEATEYVRENFTEKSLKENIVGETDIDPEFQLAALVMFKKYMQLAQGLSNFNSAMRSDVLGAGKDYSELMAIRNTVRKVLYEKKVSGLDEVFANTQVGTFYENSVRIAEEVIEQLFNINKVDNIVDEIGNDITGNYITNAKDITDIHRSLYTYFYFSGEIAEMTVQEQQDLFTGKDNLGKRIKLARRGGENVEGAYLLNSLKIEAAKFGGQVYNFISLPSSTKADSEFKDDIRNAWLELLRSNDENLRQIGEDLIKHGFLSTGFKKGLGSTFDYIPNEWFFRSNFAKNVQSKFDDIDSQASFEEAVDFVYLDNEDNPKFVPNIETLGDRENLFGSLDAFMISNPTKTARRFVKDNNGFIYKFIGKGVNGEHIYLVSKKIKVSLDNKYSYYRIRKDSSDKTLLPPQGVIEKFTDLRRKVNALVDKSAQEVRESIFEDINSISDRDLIYSNERLQLTEDAPKAKQPQAGVRKGVSTQPAAEVKSIKMQPDNIVKILSGEKTTTLRTSNIPSGVYSIGGSLFNLTNRGLLSIEEAGGVEAISESEAFAETGPKFSSTKDFLEGKRKLYVIDITKSEKSDAFKTYIEKYGSQPAAGEQLSLNLPEESDEDAEARKRCKGEN